MSKTKQALWTKFGGKEFFARMAENAKNDGEGNEIYQTYATKDVATTTADGLLSKDDKSKLNKIAAGAQVNAIESISANGTALSPDDHKNVDIPLATSEVDGLLPKEKFPLIPAAPEVGADRIYSFDDTNGTSWQTIVKEYVGNMILDQQGTPVEGEEGDITHDEGAVSLWLSYKGTEFGARRAYEDHTGQNINEALATKTTMSQVNNAIEAALANYGGFVVVGSLTDGHPDVANPSERFIYLYKDPQLSVTDPYTEWIYTTSHEWDVIGETTIDVTGKQDSLSALPSMAASKFLQTDANQNIVWGNLPQMSGATSSAAGTAGLVPAPTAGDQAKFLKGDGTWATPPEVNLANYYYDDRGNGLSAKRTGYDRPYATTSLVGGHGNMNGYTIDATFFIDWGGIARNFFSVNTYDPGASRIGFGNNSTDARAMRYLLPTPVANKYAKTDANGQITWGDVPSLPASTTTDSGKMLGVDSSGNAGWLTFENLGLMKARTNLVAGPRVTYLDINVSPSSGIFVYQTNNGVQYTYYGVPYTPNTTTDGQVLMYNGNSGPYWGTVPGLPTSAVGDAGKVLTVNSSGAAEWLLPSSMTGATASTAGSSGLVPAPEAGDEEKLLTGDGNWTALENDVFGTRLPGEETGEPMYDASSTDQLWTGFAGKEFGAARAYADQDGNNIKATYATKEDLNAALGNIESLLAAL